MRRRNARQHSNSTPQHENSEEEAQNHQQKLQSWPVWIMLWGKAGTDVLAPEYYYYNNVTFEQTKKRPNEFGMMIWSNGAMTMQGQAPPRRRRPKLPPGLVLRKREPEKFEVPSFLQHPLAAIKIQNAWRCRWARHEVRIHRGFRETIESYHAALEEFEEKEKKRLAEEAKRNSKRKTQHIATPPTFHFTPGVQSPNDGWIDLFDSYTASTCYFHPGPGGHHPEGVDPKTCLRRIRMKMAGVQLVWERPYETPEEIRSRLLREKIAEQRRLDDEMLLAGRTGDVFSAKKFVRQGANPRAWSTIEGLALVHYASDRGLMNVLFWLVNECDLDLAVERDRYGCTGLHHAARSGNLRVMKYLVEKCNVDPNEPDSRGRTPLLYASSGAHLETVRWLKEECRVDISAEDCSGCTAAHRAVTSPVCHTNVPRVNKVLSYLAGAGLNMEEDDHWGWTPIDKAATCDNKEVVAELERHGCRTRKQPGDKNPDEIEGWKPSHQAAMLGESQRIRWLYKRGIDLNETDKRGESPLFHACAGGHYEAVQTLLRCGADIDPRRRNNIKQNAEDIAIKHGHHDCAKLIADTRERIQKKNARLAREAAAEKERIKVEKELEEELRRIGKI